MEAIAKKENRTPYRVISVIVLLLLTVLFMFPLYWILTGSFKTAAANNANPPVWFPLEPTTQNYVDLFSRPAWTWMLNTILICAGAMVLTCITSSMAG